MLIVLEGLDGAGKSTQVRLLRQYLQSVCPRLDYIHFPRYDAPVYGELVSKFLRGGFGTIESVHPQLVALLFAEDRHSAAEQIRESLRSGGTVLLDRYVYSNIAYQCAKLPSSTEAQELRDWIFHTEYHDFAIPVPDLNIFLDVPVGFVEENLSKSRGGDERDYLQGQTDIHEADIAFQKRVREIYLQQAAKDEKFIVVPCGDESGRMLPKETIFERLKQQYESHKKD